MSFDRSNRGGAPTAYDNLDLKPTTAIARAPSMRFAFEFPELATLFETADQKANRARDRNRRSGILGVALVLAALLYASSAPLRAEMDHALAGPFGFAAAGLGMGGTVLGLAGLRRGSSRGAWLTERLKTESLRLFHFWYIAARLPEIEAAAHDINVRDSYLKARKAAFDSLLATELRDPDRALQSAIAPGASAPIAAIDELPAPHGPISASAADVFGIWRTVRLEWQLRYCDAKLSHHRTGARWSPLQQEHAFSRLGWGCIGLVVVLHAAHFAEGALHLPAVWLETGIVGVALVALAGRALEDGLKPQREVERYEQYRANIRVARERFDAATDLASKLEVMRAFEQTSLEEMRVFLRSQATARFLL